mgnify:CR=1 FL=1
MENLGLFDKWSKQHFMVGAVVGGFGLFNVWQYLILHSLFEVWENTIGVVEWQQLGWKKYEGDSALNIIGDTISGTAGFYVLYKLLDGKMASPIVLGGLLTVGALMSYYHPKPVDKDFMPDKYRKAIATIGLLGVTLAAYIFLNNNTTKLRL